MVAKHALKLVTLIIDDSWSILLWSCPLTPLTQDKEFIIRITIYLALITIVIIIINKW